MSTYEPFIEREMKEFYDSLPEDKRRRYAATEASKFGKGGTKYISELLECSPRQLAIIKLHNIWSNPNVPLWEVFRTMNMFFKYFHLFLCKLYSCWIYLINKLHYGIQFSPNNI